MDRSAAMPGETVLAIRKEWDWATVREAASLAAAAAVTFAGWWLWQEWQYEDGTVVEECSSCGRHAVLELGG